MAESGDVSAAALVAQGYATGEGVGADAAAAVRWYAKAAEAGDTDAAYNAGQLLFPTNPREALKWYERAASAEVGHANAAFNLGEALREGVDGIVSRDAEGAAKWLACAAALGHEDASHNLKMLHRMPRVPQQ